MQKLIAGVHKFRSDEFGRYREMFRRLSRDGQKPHTLFITCSDSRVLAELITQRGIGNGARQVQPRPVPVAIQRPQVVCPASATR